MKEHINFQSKYSDYDSEIEETLLLYDISPNKRFSRMFSRSLNKNMIKLALKRNRDNVKVDNSTTKEEFLKGKTLTTIG